MKMIVCWASATYFQFHSRQFASRLAGEILSYSSAVTLALALSYLTITYHIAYKTLSHVYYFNILGGVKLAYVVSRTRCIYTCPVSPGMRPRPPPEVVWAIRIYIRLKCVWRAFTPGLSGSDSYPIRKTHEVTSVTAQSHQRLWSEAEFQGSLHYIIQKQQEQHGISFHGQAAAFKTHITSTMPSANGVM